MTNSSLICWPRGNDVSLTIYLYEPQVDANGIPVRDQQGNIVWEPVDVDAYDEWRVRVKTDEYILLSAAAGATAGTLVVKVPGTFPCGVYAVEFTGMKNGFAVRSFETTMFGIVESNGDANVTFDIVDGERSCDIDIKIQMVPFSVERGKNAYELWKEQPGNEDKTLQDYLDSLEPVQADWTETDPDDKAFIKNKPTIPAAQVQSDWKQTLRTAVDFIKNKPNVYSISSGEINSMGAVTGLFLITDSSQGGIIISSGLFNYAEQVWIDVEHGHIKTRMMNQGVWGAWSDPIYQPMLISGTNIKTINNQSLLGSGNIDIQGGGEQEQADWNVTNSSLPSYIKHKPNVKNVNSADIDNMTEASGLFVVTGGSGGTIVTVGRYVGEADQVWLDSEHGYIKTRKMSGGTWSAWSDAAYYIKPSSGIPKSDLASAVQTSLNKADTALQAETDPTVQAWAKTGIRLGNTVLTPETLGFLSSLFDLDVSQGNLTIRLKTGDATPVIVTGIVSSNDDSGWEHAGNGALPTVGLVYNKVTAKYTKPNSGIPKSDLASSVQTSLNNADSAIALIGDINTILDEINGEVI